MQVTRYQMQNVLDCYSKKLSRTRGKECFSTGSSRKSTDEITLSSDTSRMAAMEKISQQLLDKVMDVVALSSTGDTGRYSLRGKDAVVGSVGGPAPMEFASNELNSIDREHTSHREMDDPGEKGGRHV
jgi:hypothetical protein